MTLEQLMERLITALNENTAAHGGKVASAPAATGKAGGKAPATVPAVTFDAVKALAVKVKEKSGQPVAKKIIADVGKAESLTGVKPAQFAALLKAFDDHLSAEEEPPAEEEEEEL